MSNQYSSIGGILVDLAALSAGTGSGPQWGHESEDLDLTLLAWTAGQGVAAHVNSEVDVVLIVIAGAGDVTVNAKHYRLVPGQALVIPKNAERAIQCTGDHFSYLSLHRRRRGLWPTVTGQRHA